MFGSLFWHQDSELDDGSKEKLKNCCPTVDQSLSETGCPISRSRQYRLSGEYNLTFAPPPSGGGERNQKSKIREENSKLIRKRRDKKGGEEKNGKKKGGKGRKKEKIKERTEKIS